jgi:protein-S-isoprenylcysteine O-methyltransferase Ste14
MGAKAQALIVVPLIIGLLVGALALLAHLAVGALSIPVRLQIPTVMRATGAGVLAFGLIFMGWLFRYRSPAEILQSTYETMRKANKGAHAHERLGRFEPLMLSGPQRYVRHPLYFAVLVALLGWWLLLDYTLLLLMAVFLFLWFTMVVIRFEEQELRELFGEEYVAYARVVPMIFPSLRPRWP